MIRHGNWANDNQHQHHRRTIWNWSNDKGLLRGIGGEGEPFVDVTYSTKDDGIPLGNGQLTTKVTNIETQYFRGIGVSIGKNIDVSIYEINQIINTGRNIKSLLIYNKTTLLQYKVHIL